MMIHVKVKLLTQTAKVPEYQSSEAGCFDIFSDDGVIVPPKSSGKVRTGIAVEIPEDHVLLLFSRSGHGDRYRVRLQNSVGVIDADYRGEIMVMIANDAPLTFYIERGARIAQGLVVPRPRVAFSAVDDLSRTARGVGGFGSTGA